MTAASASVAAKVAIIFKTEEEKREKNKLREKKFKEKREKMNVAGDFPGSWQCL